jgi:hypothetical protein
MLKNNSNQSIDETVSSRPKTRAAVEKPITHLVGIDIPPASAPSTLQQFFNGEIDLDDELSKRFPAMPVMSTAHFRMMHAKHGVATLSTQDGAAMVMVDVDVDSRAVQFAFNVRSMLTFRFHLAELGDMDRSGWLEMMRREQGGLSFLWGKARWESHYVICAVHQYFTNLYAFSPQHFEAAARLTPDVTRQLVNWLENFWKAPPSIEDSQQLTTW